MGTPIAERGGASFHLTALLAAQGLQTAVHPCSLQNDEESYVRSSVGISFCIALLFFFFFPFFKKNMFLPLHPSFDLRYEAPPKQLPETLVHKERQVTDEEREFSAK